MKKNLTPELAYPKIRHYCGYSERCHYEVREKLFSMGLIKKDVEILLSRLIEEDHLNEERFAILFAGGHFRQKKWGKSKIVYALRQKKVSEQNIKRGLKEIVQEDYLASLEKLADTKWKSLQGEQYITREVKTNAYLLQKGYERQEIQRVIAKFRSGNKEKT
ncbi:MAG: regulatory protein RecX [Bacteroidota bacterium]